MSTSPSRQVETAEDRLVTLLSHWLTGQVPTGQLEPRIEAIGTRELGREQADAVGEVLAELRDPAGNPGELQMIVRETIEALALGF